MPAVTLPNATERPSKWSAGSVVMKNWEPLLCTPEFAIVRSPGALTSSSQHKDKI